MSDMPAETLAALKASIAKWERNAVAESWREASIGFISCALCSLYYSSCVGCPVMESTGVRGCVKTPYEDVESARNAWMFCMQRGGSESQAREAFRTAARAEVEFLKSLLPTGE